MHLTAWVSSPDLTVVNTNTSESEWGAKLSPLSVSASAALLDASQAPVFTVHGSGAASWTDANHGTVSFSNLGWELSNAGGDADLRPSQGGVTNTPDWRYEFIADVDTTFAMHSQVVGHDNTFGLFGWQVTIYEGQNQTIGGKTNAINPASTWDFQKSLTKGTSYKVTLVNGANVAQGGQVSYKGSMDALITWQIGSAIPEPSTISLAVAALAALATRRRKTTAHNRV
jgi:hypothetical protein